jgi:hypothetical protein
MAPRASSSARTYSAPVRSAMVDAVPLTATGDDADPAEGPVT